jgi:hypothetical protein
MTGSSFQNEKIKTANPREYWKIINSGTKRRNTGIDIGTV